MKKTLKNTYYFVAIAFCAWFALSFCQVLVHNMGAEYTYPAWNLFVLMMGA